MSSNDIVWSEWLNFDKDTIEKIPESPGVFRMHAAMKILLIENAENLQKRLLETLNQPCTCEASRFCYYESPDHENLKSQLVKEYVAKHEGKMPRCM